MTQGKHISYAKTTQLTPSVFSSDHLTSLSLSYTVSCPNSFSTLMTIPWEREQETEGRDESGKDSGVRD